MKAAPVRNTPENRALVQKLRAEGLTWYAIGMWLGTRGEHVRCWVDEQFRKQRRAHDRLLPARGRRRKGRSKWTPQREDWARRLLAAGHTWRNTARLIGVEAHTVRRWVDPEYRAKHNAATLRCHHRRRHPTTLEPAE